jgi:hypothetical protein
MKMSIINQQVDKKRLELTEMGKPEYEIDREVEQTKRNLYKMWNIKLPEEANRNLSFNFFGKKCISMVCSR